ncbi:hypothetical protein EDB19DRAFT_1832110 [Suillus lakei]|nr:hypothetical protein EDB19DRAFT_1832110 [Suillus lakei]
MVPALNFNNRLELPGFIASSGHLASNPMILRSLGKQEAMLFGPSDLDQRLMLKSTSSPALAIKSGDPRKSEGDTVTIWSLNPEFNQALISIGTSSLHHQLWLLDIESDPKKTFIASSGYSALSPVILRNPTSKAGGDTIWSSDSDLDQREGLTLKRHPDVSNRSRDPTARRLGFTPPLLHAEFVIFPLTVKHDSQSLPQSDFRGGARKMMSAEVVIEGIQFRRQQHISPVPKIAGVEFTPGIQSLAGRGSVIEHRMLIYSGGVLQYTGSMSAADISISDTSDPETSFLIFPTPSCQCSQICRSPQSLRQEAVDHYLRFPPQAMDGRHHQQATRSDGSGSL